MFELLTNIMMSCEHTSTEEGPVTFEKLHEMVEILELRADKLTTDIEHLKEPIRKLHEEQYVLKGIMCNAEKDLDILRSDCCEFNTSIGICEVRV